jgi:hypothetical protein
VDHGFFRRWLRQYHLIEAQFTHVVESERFHIRALLTGALVGKTTGNDMFLPSRRFVGEPSLKMKKPCRV